MGESENDTLRVDVDRELRLEFHGAKVTSDAGLLAYRELDDAFRLTAAGAKLLADARTGANTQHTMTALLRQAVLGRLAGYEDTNEADRLRVDPAMRHVVGGRAKNKPGASTSEMGRFETEFLTMPENVAALTDTSGLWVDRVRSGSEDLLLDMDSSESETYGEQEGSAWNGHCGLRILHTWSATLDYHPHVHCLVPAGALAKADGSWRPARPNFLVPVRALSKLFKGIFGELLRKRRPDLVTAPECWRKPWVVYCKPAIQGTQTVLDYLGRYVHRIAIANTRISSIADGRITFRYKDHRSNSWRTMALQAQEFIRRFLQHVLPAGFHKIRYVGLWSSPNRLLLRRLQLLLAAPQQNPNLPAIPDSQGTLRSHLDGRACPACHLGTLHLVRRLQARRSRPP